jgi:hypothetical protein
VVAKKRRSLLKLRRETKRPRKKALTDANQNNRKMRKGVPSEDELVMNFYPQLSTLIRVIHRPDHLFILKQSC